MVWRCFGVLYYGLVCVWFFVIRFGVVLMMCGLRVRFELGLEV